MIVKLEEEDLQMEHKFFFQFRVFNILMFLLWKKIYNRSVNFLSGLGYDFRIFNGLDVSFMETI